MNDSDQSNQVNNAPLGDVFSGSAVTPPAQDQPAQSDTPVGAPVLPSFGSSNDESDGSKPADAPAPDLPSEPPTDSSDNNPEATPAEPAAELETSSDSSADNKSDDSVMATSPSDDLTAMKQEALGELQPLVAHLDQTPEEEFKTAMMMIQANDDQNLLKKAFDASKKIKDDKERAQALLDVINEINYFTQHQE